MRPFRPQDLPSNAIAHTPDHQGVAKEICDAHGIPLDCHTDDVDAMEGRRPASPGAWERPPRTTAFLAGR